MKERPQKLREVQAYHLRVNHRLRIDTASGHVWVEVVEVRHEPAKCLVTVRGTTDTGITLADLFGYTAMVTLDEPAKG